MASAIEKFQEAMNKTSLFWSKQVEIVAQEGKVILIKCEGFVWKSDPEKREGD